MRLASFSLINITHSLRGITIAFVFVFSTLFSGMGQQTAPTEGKITYKYTLYYSKMVAQLPFLSEAEKTRMQLSWGTNDEGDKQKMTLLFSPKESLYTYASTESEEYTYSWRNDDFIIYRNFADSTLIELQQTIGKTYLIKDDLRPYKWRVMNELKEIQGHLCMKAVMQDTLKNQTIEAWFAADIPVPAGPEKLYGLPGVILGVDINGGVAVIEAEKIEFKPVAEELKLPKKMKGKEINLAEYDRLLENHFKESIQAQRNPYWPVRY